MSDEINTAQSFDSAQDLREQNTDSEATMGSEPINTASEAPETPINADTPVQANNDNPPTFDFSPFL